jgi:hypothetical protein
MIGVLDDNGREPRWYKLLTSWPGGKKGKKKG